MAKTFERSKSDEGKNLKYFFQERLGVCFFSLAEAWFLGSVSVVELTATGGRCALHQSILQPRDVGAIEPATVRDEDYSPVPEVLGDTRDVQRDSTFSTQARSRLDRLPRPGIASLPGGSLIVRPPFFAPRRNFLSASRILTFTPYRPAGRLLSGMSQGQSPPMSSSFRPTARL
ncbi:MAG: hypothetical protein ACKV22_32560, partial [Bryobacteraceae bacterium]